MKTVQYSMKRVNDISIKHLSHFKYHIPTAKLKMSTDCHTDASKKNVPILRRWLERGSAKAHGQVSSDRTSRVIT